MAEEIKTKRAFHEDIFAEDQEKWSWPMLGSKSKATPATTTNYTSEVKSDSSRSSDSANGFLFRDSDSREKKSLSNKVGSSSDGKDLEDMSSNSSVVGPRERLMPSIYDDDAQSGSPSGGVFEKKDLAFQSSFKKNFPLAQERSRSREKSPEDKLSSERESRSGKVSDQNSGFSPGRRQSTDSRPLRSFEDALPKRSHSRSKSRDVHSRKGSRTRSRSRERRRERRRSKDRRGEKERSRHGKGHRSRSRESRRHRDHYRSSSRDRYRRRRYSRSRSRSREHSKGSRDRKTGSLSLSTSGGVVTPQMALQQQMAALHAKTQAQTGIALPKYYNPAAVNPQKYAEQVQKRKLLWQSKEKVEQEQPQPKNTVWDKLTFAQDQDGKMTAKFRKLMGIKSEKSAATEAEEKESQLKKQEELFHNLGQQYEMARITTHTQRGVGLGYSAQPLYQPAQK